MKLIVFGFLFISLLSCRFERNLINGGIHIVSNKRSSENKIADQNSDPNSNKHSSYSAKQVKTEQIDITNIESDGSNFDSIPNVAHKSLSKPLKIESIPLIKPESSSPFKNTSKKRKKSNHAAGFILSMSGLMLFLICALLFLFSSELGVILFGLLLGLIAFLIMFIAVWISLSDLKAARTKKQRLLATVGLIVASLFSLTGIVLLLIFVVNSLKY
jgi:cation transport ATPase